MQALEFQTYISNGMIKIPKNCKIYNNRKVKVIMLLPDEKGNYDKQKLLSAFENAHKLNVFSEITKPVEWQKQLRNEWE
ncbi:MAG: hypothetical protein U9N85_09560 [Bacteroidota bacterium]|nr:hypothetical protein [Bacteroidota bacterium]